MVLLVHHQSALVRLSSSSCSQTQSGLGDSCLVHGRLYSSLAILQTGGLALSLSFVRVQSKFYRCLTAITTVQFRNIRLCNVSYFNFSLHFKSMIEKSI